MTAIETKFDLESCDLDLSLRDRHCLRINRPKARPNASIDVVGACLLVGTTSSPSNNEGKS